MEILTKDKIRLNVKAKDKFDAIRMAGDLLVESGHVNAEYVEQMIEREKLSSTYLGNRLAMPHGTNEAKRFIQSTGISVLVLAEDLDFDGEPTRLVIGLAAVGDEHLEVLSKVAELVSDEDDLNRILDASSEDELLALFVEEVDT